MGSRFVATRESIIPEVHKKLMLERTSETTAAMDAFSGRFARVLRHTFTEQYAQSGAPVLPFPLQMLANGDIRQEAMVQDRGDYMPLWSSRGVGLIRDLPGAGNVIETTIQEARQVMLERLPQSVRLDG